MPGKTDISILLKQYRKNCNLTQQQVADALNINRTTYTYYETGKTEPSISTLHKLVKMFGITYNDLLPEIDDENIGEGARARLNDAIYALSKEEQQVVIQFRALSAERKKELLDSMK
jgi:transcriptional regulator with XRE-family HTH domain